MIIIIIIIIINSNQNLSFKVKRIMFSGTFKYKRIPNLSQKTRL